MYSGYPKDLIAIVCCPQDGKPLHASLESSVDRVFNGEAKCTGCGISYQIREGILRLLPGQRPLDTLVRDEQQARDDRATRYEAHFDEWENAEELSALLADPEQFRSKTILDLACGTGRLTRPVAALAAATVAADMSEVSLRVLASQVPNGIKIGLIWGDAVQLRFAPESFDAVLSTQLMQSIPGRENRVQLLRAAHSSLKPSGTLLLTLYYYSLLRRILKRKQEGFHAGGIFYHRFTIAEILAELSHGFQIVQTRCLQPDRRVLARLGSTGAWARKGIQNRVLARLVGQLLFIRAQKSMELPSLGEPLRAPGEAFAPAVGRTGGAPP
jgi:SAM-dependent methyltransferase